jgi:hypothetical protein
MPCINFSNGLLGFGVATIEARQQIPAEIQRRFCSNQFYTFIPSGGPIRKILLNEQYRWD